MYKSLIHNSMQNIKESGLSIVWILVIVAVVIVGGFIFFFSQQPEEEKGIVVDNEGNMMTGGDIIYDYIGELSDVSGGSGSGLAKATFQDDTYNLLATFTNIPDPTGSDFYEGWVVIQEPLSFISTGVIENKDGAYANVFSSDVDLTDYNFYVLTLEPDDGDPLPAKHIVEGTMEKKSLITTPTGLQIENVKVGEGAEAKSGDQVAVHYVGTFEDGSVFDSSRAKNTSFTFLLGAGRVIQGWDEGVLGMKVGGVRNLVIPPNLAYGAQGIPGAIPANATLYFEVELLQIQGK